MVHSNHSKGQEPCTEHGRISELPGCTGVTAGTHARRLGPGLCDWINTNGGRTLVESAKRQTCCEAGTQSHGALGVRQAAERQGIPVQRRLPGQGHAVPAPSSTTARTASRPTASACAARTRTARAVVASAALAGLLTVAVVPPSTAAIRQVVEPAPTASPTVSPTPEPTPGPTDAPTPTPTADPTLSPTPTAEPTLSPTPGTPTEPTPDATPRPGAANDWAEDALTPDDGLLFGASVAKGTHASVDAAVSAFEASIGRKLDVHRWYALWDELPSTPLTTTVQRGRTPLLSVSSKKIDGTKISWAAVASGAHDAQIVQHANAVKALRVPMYVSFQHEPDYSPGFGAAADYRAAFRHYVEVFRAQGVTNAVWTWIVTPTPFAPYAAVSADALYPGDDVVDQIALDAYNWFGCATNGQTSWSSMSRAASAFRAFGRAHGKPLVIAEWGSVEDPAVPGRKAAWLRESMATLESWPEVTAVLYFHHHGSCSWFVDSTPSSLEAFADVADSPAAHTRPSAFLQTSTTHGTAPLSVTFDASRSSGAGGGAGEHVASWSLSYGDGTTERGTGAPPATLAHVYGPGDHSARLTVTDTAGGTSTDSVAITAADPPTGTLDQKDVTDTSATLYAWVDLHGYAGTVRFQYGRTLEYLGGDSTVAVPAVSYVKTVSQPIAGIRPGTTYYWKATITSPAGTTELTRTFETAGAPTSSNQFTASSTSTSTTFRAQVHPHRLTTTAWIEWGPTTALGTSSPVTTLPALTYEKTVASNLVTGLAPRTTYYYRVVATNAQGTLYGPVRSFTTPR